MKKIFINLILNLFIINLANSIIDNRHLFYKRD